MSAGGQQAEVGGAERREGRRGGEGLGRREVEEGVRGGHSGVGGGDARLRRLVSNFCVGDRKSVV